MRLRDIMTHTPGFEESVKELIADDPARLTSIEESVKRWVPERIYEAGTMPAYSNYATGLAGYIVSRTSGMSFDDYLDRNVFGPLGMANSSFRQPLPAALKAGVSQGYEQASKEPQGYELINLAPAGSLAATGADMARFMIAHLQDGAYGDARILSEETAKQMHGTPLTILPNVNRMVLGFYETSTNGHRIISHGGDTQYFHSDLQLYLDHGVGYFISFNSAGKEGAVGQVREAFYRRFTDRYFPGPLAEGSVDEETARQHAAEIAGSYVGSRRADSSLLSILNLLQPLTVAVNEDGTISVPLMRDLNGEPNMAAILSQARGEKVEVVLSQTAVGQPANLTGSVVGVEVKQLPAAGGDGPVVTAEVLNLWCADGIRSVRLTDVQRLRFSDPDRGVGNGLGITERGGATARGQHRGLPDSWTRVRPGAGARRHRRAGASSHRGAPAHSGP